MKEICSRLNLSGQLNEVTVADIKALRSHGIPLEDIKKAIAQTTNTSMETLDKLFDDVVERNQRYYTELIDLARVTMPETLVDAAAVAAIRKQTRDELRNITRSMGFLVNGGKTMLPPAKAYQHCLDMAVMQIESGAISYNQAIASAVRELAGGGLKVVNYESGHVDHIDVAARRAVMTGVGQVNAKYREQSMDDLGTDLVQVTAHSGARDTGSGFYNHRSWQGKVYHWNRDGSRGKSKYPDFVETCGYGDGGGIGGWNCRHAFRPFVDGVMEPTYTQKQLDEIDPPPFEYQGKQYNAYQATQQQRKIERSIRKQKRLEASFKAAGLEDDARAAKSKLRALNKEYRQFSKAAGLPEQQERTKVLYT